ncbi:MAG: recombinase family protein, partial [Cyanobacteria bacterium J06639_1]
LSDLSNAQELDDRVVTLSQQGWDDETIAEQLTQEGFRSPLTPTLLVSTVKAIRLKHRIFRKRSQSHPRRVPGYLTIPQIAASLNISPHWIYHRINTGRITVTRDEDTKLYLFPDEPDTLAQFQDLLSEKLEKLRF